MNGHERGKEKRKLKEKGTIKTRKGNGKETGRI